MKNSEKILQIADFLVNSLEHCSLDEAVTYLEKEYNLEKEVGLKLITDFFIKYAKEPIIFEADISEFVQRRI